MNEQQLRRIFKEAFTEQNKRLERRFIEQDEQLGARFAEQESRLDNRAIKREQHLEERLSQQITDESLKIITHLTNDFDSRLKAEIQPLKEGIDAIYNILDCIVGRIKTDSEEQAAIAIDQDRHKIWITQLASHSNVKLVPEP
ncbi:MAG TPA: hypothetical protein VNX65_02485 [Patescibacteria group bacterium]|jgi:hypothetical protein|nr:hypothetical protein [Patescibacteria group bacterium]